MHSISKRPVVPNSLIPLRKKIIKYNRFTNIFLIKSYVDLYCTKARPVYLWQNQAWLKDEVIHSCQGILIIWLLRVEVLFSLRPPAKRIAERAQNARKSAAALIWQFQNDFESGRKYNYWFLDILICQFQLWQNPVFCEKWRIQKQNKLICHSSSRS